MARNLRAVIRTVLLVPTFFLVTLVMAAILIVFATFRRDSALVEGTIRLWSRLFLAVGGVRLRVETNDKVVATGQYLFVANHLSNLDIPTMFVTAPVPIRYLAKKEIYKIPLVATAMRMVGIVRVDRGAGTSVHAEVNTGVAEATARGHSIIIFPEGTRSETGELQPFKKGAFRIAIANGLPIVPVAINGTWEAWPPGSKLVFGSRATTIIHDPIPTEGLDVSHINQIRDEAYRVIEKTLGELRAQN